MYSIRQIADAIEKTVPTHHLTEEEQVSAEQDKAEYVAKLDKGLRNLSQRIYLPATERRGRIDLYDRSTVAAFGLIVALSDFDVPLNQLQAFAKWVQQPGGIASPMLGNRRASPIEEAVQRIEEREDFTFEILGAAFGRRIYRARWSEEDAFFRMIDKGRSPYPAISMPASKLIRALFAGLED